MPELSKSVIPVDLSMATMSQRKDKLLQKMREQSLDVVVIYADKEHGANFEYLTGFIPRFEEALLIVHKNGQSYLLLGNENLKLASHSRIQAELIHVPFFSLPNQPMEGEVPLKEMFLQAQISPNDRIGIVGWKNFTSRFEDNTKLYDIPYFIVDVLKKISTKESNIVNSTNIFISSASGIRTINNANEIAHYEYGATLAGMGVLNTLNAVTLQKTELILANNLLLDGQPNNVVTICASGERFTNANLYPRNKKISLGDTFSTSVGYKGGLSSRAAYVAFNENDLPVTQRDYVSRLAAPYYKAVITWLESIKIGANAKDVFAAIENVLPKKEYHWKLNPGHYVSDEEWLSSPFYPDSTAQIKSGQLLQVDIIPSISGYGGAGCEDGIAVADQQLRAEIADQYPEIWLRMKRRRNFLQDKLNINIAEEILPLNDIVAYYRPYVLNHEVAFKKEA